jgi:hypothetical protein
MSEIDKCVFHPSRSRFLAIFDSEGDIQEVFSHNSVRDEVFRRCEVLDTQFPSCSPHTLWEHDRGDWHRMKERIHSDHSALRISTPMRTK